MGVDQRRPSAEVEKDIQSTSLPVGVSTRQRVGNPRFRLQPLLVGTPSSITLEVSGRQNLGLYLQHPEVLPRQHPPKSKDAKSPEEGVEPYYKPGVH